MYLLVLLLVFIIKQGIQGKEKKHLAGTLLVFVVWPKDLILGVVWFN